MLARLFPHVYEGWLVVGASTTVLFVISASVFWGLGPVFNPLVDEFGWSVGATSFAFAVRSEVNGIAAPFVGAALDRAGARRLMLIGITVASVGLFAMSFMQNIWQFYALMLLVALGTSTSGGQATMVSTVSWFERKRARALALATAGGTMGGVFVVVAAVLVETLGWRGALRIMALMMLLVGLAAGSNVRMRPEHHAQPIDGEESVSARAGDGGEYRRWGVPLAAALRSPVFWVLAFAQLAIFFSITAIVVHHVPFMEDEVGISKTAAGVGSAIFALSSLVGRIVSGVAADRFDKRIVLAVIVLLAALAMPAFAFVQNLWQAGLVLLVMAAGIGGANPIRTALLADYFGTRSFGSINGVSMLVATFGAFLGPLLVGVTFDWTGERTLGFVVSGAVALLAIPAVLAARPPRRLIEQHRSVAPPTAPAVVPAPARDDPAG